MGLGAACAACPLIALLVCHPSPSEGPVQLAANGMGPSILQGRGPKHDSGEGAAPVIAHFGTLFTTISSIRLLFASVCLYNPARLVLPSLIGPTLQWQMNGARQLSWRCHRLKSSLAKVRSCGWARRKPSSLSL